MGFRLRGLKDSGIESRFRPWQRPSCWPASRKRTRPKRNNSTIHLLHADTAFATPISHCGDVEHEGKVDQFANYAFEVVPSAHIDIATFEEKGLKKATLGATEPTDTICLLFKAIGSCRKNEGNLAASRRW